MASQKLVAVVALAIFAMACTAVAQNDYVKQHNAARSAVGVGPVVWDDAVAEYARSYANKRKADCALQHSVGMYGENIFWGSAGKDWSAADAVKSWVSEKQYYHYNTNTCDSGKVCGHYTQVVWRKSTKIGCARIVCNNKRGVFIICNYKPAGNVRGQKPY